MSLLGFGEIRPLVRTVFQLSQVVRQTPAVTQVRNYAARKGTRERKRKSMKPKVEEVKLTFKEKLQKEKEKLLGQRPSKIVDDSWKPTPKDNVYLVKYYKWPIYSFSEAIEAHRETHDPTIYNKPNSYVQVLIELNMATAKKTKFLDNFHRIVAVPHPFDHGQERTILAFTKDAKLQEMAKAAGVGLTGGVELIREIQNGNVSLHDFNHVIAHPTILPELVPLRGLMKRKFPNPKLGTLDVNFMGMVDRILKGIEYSGVKDEYEKVFGTIETNIGTLNMDVNELEGNFRALMTDISSVKPKTNTEFIRRCLILSAPSREKLRVDHNLYISSDTGDEANDDEDDDEVAEPIEAKAQ